MSILRCLENYLNSKLRNKQIIIVEKSETLFSVSPVTLVRNPHINRHNSRVELRADIVYRCQYRETSAVNYCYCRHFPLTKPPYLLQQGPLGLYVLFIRNCSGGGMMDLQPSQKYRTSEPSIVLMIHYIYISFGFPFQIIPELKRSLLPALASVPECFNLTPAK